MFAVNDDFDARMLGLKSFLVGFEEFLGKRCDDDNFWIDVFDNLGYDGEYVELLV